MAPTHSRRSILAMSGAPFAMAAGLIEPAAAQPPSTVTMTRPLTEIPGEAAIAKARGILDVYNNRYSAGAPLGARPRPNQTNLPPWVTREGTQILKVQRPGTWNPATPMVLSDLDLTGMQVLADGDLILYIRRSLLITDPARAFQPIKVGNFGHIPDAGKAQVWIEDCTVSLATNDPRIPTSLQLGGYGARFRRSRFERLAMDICNHDGPGDLEIEGCYIEAPGQNPRPGGHCESVNASGGRVTCKTTFIDGVGAFEGVAPPDTGVSGPAPFVQARHSPVTYVEDRTLLLPRQIRSYQSQQISDDRFGVNATITNSVRAGCVVPDGSGRLSGPITYVGKAKLKGTGNIAWLDGSSLRGMNLGL